MHLLAHSLLHSIPVPFPNWNVPASLPAISFVAWLYIPLLLPSFSSFRLQYLDTPTCSVLPPNIRNILPPLPFPVALFPLSPSLHTASLYWLLLQIYSGESVSPLPLLSYFYSYRPGIQTFYTSNISFFPFLLFLPLA